MTACTWMTACTQAELAKQLDAQLSSHKLMGGTAAPSALRRRLGMRAEGLGECLASPRPAPA